ncbi:hypothetical protein LVD15_11870 [Fulvivirga maritima]|uniref:hypothetical protein n=1 Tax=Fulvivirga maritima TaxID=2904247 RepID=UPI001F485BE6|nr:hypothetical protein [Fulvivirga maritima]UII29093.1 hypothetical protein LVD15_11870 [Fulvivirga maritima]
MWLVTTLLFTMCVAMALKLISQKQKAWIFSDVIQEKAQYVNMPIINPPTQNSDSLEHDPANSSPVVISAKP